MAINMKLTRRAAAITLLLLPAFARAEWLGEWGAWTQKDAKASTPSYSGMGLKIHSCAENTKLCRFQIVIHDAKKQACSIDGQMQFSTATEAKSTSLKACEISFAQDPTKNDAMTLSATGDGCSKVCTSSNLTKALPASLALRSHVMLAETLPAPQCQADLRTSAQLFCADQAIAKRALAAKRFIEEFVAFLPKVNLPADHALLAEPDGEWMQKVIQDCEKETEPRKCVESRIDKHEAEWRGKLSEIKAIKARFDAELGSFADAKTAKTNMEAVHGTYKRTFMTSASGDKFEVTDEMTLIATEDNELEFDILLNFKNEQQCELTGGARPLKSGKFLFRESANSKKKDSKCKLLIYKEGESIVVTDEPSGSCSAYCGKGSTFTRARFPFSSRGKVQ